jgi:hypothetical protein
MHNFFFLLGLAFLMSGNIATAKSDPMQEYYINGEFQFSARFNNKGVDGEVPRDFTAYLWIPPTSKKLRGVILTHQNVGEQIFIEHPAIRRACAENDLAIVWCYPAIDLRFELNRETAVTLQENVLKELSEVSGYEELEQVPWVTFGHSTTVTFARNLAEARPNRIIAVIMAKGGIFIPAPEHYSGPIIFSAGQYPEWRQPTHDWNTHGMSLGGIKKIRDAQAAGIRPLSYIEEYGGGHFDYSEKYLNFLALYIDKAVKHRVNADGSLRKVSPNEGYVVEMQYPLPQPPLKVARLTEASGDMRYAPWFFDREIAEAAAALMGSEDWNRKNQIVAFANLDGTPATFARNGIADPVPYELDEDGVTVKRIETTFLEHLPDNFVQAGTKLTHANCGARTIERISGVFTAENGKHRIKLNRGYPLTPNFIAVRHAGDTEHRPTIQPGRFVLRKHEGREQTITFSAIEKPQNGGNNINLRATSSAGLKVEFFVRSGPAKIVGNQLVVLPLPPRTKLPVEISVVAWQLGRGGSDPVSAAPTIEQSFYLYPDP